MPPQALEFRDASWLNPPPQQHRDTDSLRFLVEPGTDFWRHTHYGFCRDNGHVLLSPASTDFDAELWLRYAPEAQYDQAGLMLRIDAENWLKTAVEHEPEAAPRLGVVVTQGPGSDWSTQDLEQSPGLHGFRLERRGPDLMIQARLATQPRWQQLRIVRMATLETEPRLGIGPYACCPQGAGFEVELLSWQLQAR